MQLKKPQGPWHKGASVLVAMATTAGLFLVGTGAASATSAPTIPIQATITPNSTGPNIECSWLVADNNLAGGAETSNTNPSAHDYTGQPYTSSPGATAPTPPGGSTTVNGLSTAINYSGTTNSINTGGPPCALPAEPNNNLPNPGAPEQANNANLGVDVVPNLFDAANQNFSGAGDAQRRVELWAAVDDLNGVSYVSDVYWDIYRPDGTLLAEVFSAAPIEGASACTMSTNLNVLTPMFAQAVADGELSSGAVNDLNNGILTLCNEGTKSLWHNAFTFSKDDPNGTYTIVTRAVDKVGAISNLAATFKVDAVIGFEQDFSTVNWGPMVPGTAKQVAGDTTFDPPNSSSPTIINGGNSGMQVGVEFFPLTGMVYGKTIGTPGSTGNGFFDANFGYNSSYLQTLSPLAPSVVYWFANSGAQLVCPNDTPKLDLSIHPQTGIPADTYKGNMVVWFQSAPTQAGGCPTDEGHTYTPVAGDSGAPVRNPTAG